MAVGALLAVDAYVHAIDAGFYDANAGSLLSQGTLFRMEAVAAALVALAVTLWPSATAWWAALAVAASAAGAALLYRYVDVGAVWPLPDLYEPTWASPGKLVSVGAEGLAALCSVVGLVTHRRRA